MNSMIIGDDGSAHDNDDAETKREEAYEVQVPPGMPVY